MPSIPNCLSLGSTVAIGGTSYIVLDVSWTAASNDHFEVLEVKIVPTTMAAAGSERPFEQMRPRTLTNSDLVEDVTRVVNGDSSIESAQIEDDRRCEALFCDHARNGQCTDTKVCDMRTVGDGIVASDAIQENESNPISMPHERSDGYQLRHERCDTDCRYQLRHRCRRSVGTCEQRTLLEDPPILSMPLDEGENKARNDQASRELLAKAANHAARAKALLDRITKLRESIGGEYLRVEEEKAREDYETLMADIEDEL